MLKTDLKHISSSSTDLLKGNKPIELIIIKQKRIKNYNESYLF